MSDQLKKPQSGKKVKPKASKWRIVFWALAVIVLGFFIVCAAAWQNRYDLLEWQVRKEFANVNIDADLEIKSITGQDAVVDNISLAAQGEEFFAAKRVIVNYDYKQVRDGVLEKITLSEPSLTLVLDAQGKIINDWMPKASPQRDIIFPLQGMIIEDAKIDWQAPFGSGDTLVNADIKSMNEWIVRVKSKATNFKYDDVLVNFAFQGVAEQKDRAVLTAIGSLETPGLDTPVLRTGAAKTDYNFTFLRPKTAQGIDGQKMDVKGWMHTYVSALKSSNYALQSGDLRLDVDTAFDLQSRRFETFASKWAVETTGAVLNNKTQKKELARTISAADALEKTPIAQYFSDYFPSAFDELLQKFDLSGRGGFNYSPSGYNLKLGEELKITGKAQTIHITGAKDLLVYNAGQGEIGVSADINWQGERPILLKNLKMLAASSDGKTMDGVKNLQMQMRSTTNWTRRIEGEDFRLAPLDIDMSYAQQGERQTTRIRGNIDYDGLVPGGAVSGLKAGGDLIINMRPDELAVEFITKNILSIGTFSSASGWRAEDIKFNIDEPLRLSSGGISSGGANSSSAGNERLLAAVLQNATAQIISPEDDRHLDMRLEAVDVNSVLSETGQKWDFIITDAHINSEDFPSPGTKIYSKQSQLHVDMDEAGNIRFETLNPLTQIKTNNVNAQDIAINLSGAPDDFTAQYTAKRVEMIGGDIPALPMRGTARLQAGRLTGNAITDLPQTKDTPINIKFQSVDGQGEAVIDIPNIEFSPNGLQPQYLVSSLKGKLADVSGSVSAHFNFAFGGGKPVRSSGTTNLTNLDIGTLVGPISGVDTKLVFSSIFPLKTDGVQTATLKGFDPGFPLDAGHIRFEIVPGGVRIDAAEWPVTNVNSALGRIYISPMEWRFGDVENRAVVNIENVELGTILARVGKDKFSATGGVSGSLPAIIKGVDVHIDEGVLAVKDGGVIRFKSAGTDAAGQGNENAGMAFKALENFNYKKLEARIDGPLDGEMNVNMVFDGTNAEVLNGQSFAFDVNIAGELVNISRNLASSISTEENIKRIIALQTGKD